MQDSGFWAAANGGVTNGGLRGVWPPLPEIGRNRPFSPFFCLFRPFPDGLESTWKIQKTEEKGLFPQISSDFLKPPSLKPPFAAPQGLRSNSRIEVRGSGCEIGLVDISAPQSKYLAPPPPSPRHPPSAGVHHPAAPPRKHLPLFPNKSTPPFSPRLFPFSLPPNS